MVGQEVQLMSEKAIKSKKKKKLTLYIATKD